MRISSKGRYALVSMIYMARRFDSKGFITVASISERFGISKIYLEQVFALLKKGGLVISTKGSQGGYQISRSPSEITAYDILFSVENTLFEDAEDTVAKSAPAYEKAINNLIFVNLDTIVRQTLCGITLKDLVDETDRNDEQSLMYYI
ncbi:MAG: Rrf2 family transcriptional regulator [Clostridiales bacterium]|nr:Rrf2 family transcriptional regulator [Clostridiales bacterium]